MFRFSDTQVFRHSDFQSNRIDGLKWILGLSKCVVVETQFIASVSFTIPDLSSTANLEIVEGRVDSYAAGFCSN
jgi:hypothetical protein